MRTLRASLAGLLAAVLVPLLTAGAAVLVYQWGLQRERAVSSLQEHARTLQRAIDREMALDQAVLTALAASPEIDARDWPSFHALARQVSAVRPGSWFVLYDATGQNVVNTSVPFGTPLPNLESLRSTGSEVDWEGRQLPLPGPDFFRAPLETGRPSFSGLMYGPVNRRPVVANAVAVIRDGKPVYVLGLGYTAEFFVKLLKTERSPPGVTTAIFDRAGRFVARNRDAERFVGLRAPAPFANGGDAIPEGEGVGETVNAESIPIAYAYARSSANGWILAAGMPKAAVLAPAWNALGLWVALLAAAGAVGAFLAFRLSRRIAAPLEALAARARSVGEAHADVAPTDIEEVEALRAALRDRSRAEDALRRSEERFRSVFEQAAIGMGRVGLSDARWIDVNEAFCAMLGRSREELLRTPWPEITHPEDLELDLLPFRELASGARGSYTVEKRFLHADGRHVWAKLTLSLVRDERGRPDCEIAIIEDVTDRKLAEAALRDGAERLQTIFETVPVGLFMVDATGRLVTANDEVKRLWGGKLPLASIANYAEYKGVWHDTGAPVAPGEWPALQAALHGRTIRGALIDIERFDGTRGTIMASTTPLRDAQGQLVGAVAVNQDVTELHEAHVRLEEADRRKDEFLGMLSHELRNPLAPIRNSLYVLERADPRGQQARRAKDIVSRQVAHLTRLVDDLLDVTRIARGKIGLRHEHVDLAAVTRRTSEDYRALMQDRGLELAVDVPPAPVLVNGDPARLTQVLANLLNNAAKFTPPGGRVTLSLATDEGRAVVRVRDTGVGISRDALPTIFEPFVQGKQTIARSEGGLGLGLSLVKGLVALHGGEVVAVSDGAGRGTELVVTLPLARAPAREAPPAGRGATRGRAAQGRRVLVVDDNRDAADTVAQLVEMMGHTAVIAYDAFAGLAKASEQRPDVVLCDIGLPGMDGYEFARQLRAQSAHRSTRLVALSGYAQPEDVTRARAAGFDEHVAKPPDPGRLEELLG